MNELSTQLEQIVRLAAEATELFIGTGEKEAGDQAAVDAMRTAFDQVDCQGIVRVGEGEKDEAPMLYVGEQVGNGTGSAIDVAVDPVEGTALMANNLPNAITVIAATEQDGFWDAGSAYYMDKIVVGKEAKGSFDIRNEPIENLRSIAKALNKPLNELGVYILDKPRHKALIEDMKSLSIAVTTQPEGDVVGSILALLPDSDIDVLIGIGGAPEAVITAAAVKMLGGDMQGMLKPQKDFELANLKKEGTDLDRVLYLEDMVKSDWAVFAAAGVTSGLLLKGVQEGTQCVVIDDDGVRFT